MSSRSRLMFAAMILAVIGFYGAVSADSWMYAKGVEEKVFTFGSTEIVRITDATDSQEFPRFLIRVLDGGEEVGVIPDASFEQIFASKDEELFLGVSNRGIPGTALILFDRSAEVISRLDHERSLFDYCDFSITVMRMWYSEKRPKVRFGTREVGGRIEVDSISITDCHGKRIDLDALIGDDLRRYYAERQPSEPVLVEDRYPALRDREAVGRLLFEKDRAAWLATDRVLERGGSVPDGVLGWVTTPGRDGWDVRFVSEGPEGYCSRLGVSVGSDGAGPVRETEGCEPLGSELSAMFRARQTAITAMTKRCTEAYNTVVIPQVGERPGWVVYLLAATTEPATLMVGGHARVIVGRDGNEVLEYLPLSKSCLQLDISSTVEGQGVAVVTHLLDDHPIETHVFQSIVHRVKFYVITETAMWSVDQGKVMLLMDGKEFEQYMEEGSAAAKEARDSQEK